MRPVVVVVHAAAGGDGPQTSGETLHVGGAMVVRLPGLGEARNSQQPHGAESSEDRPPLCWWQLPGGTRPSVQSTLTSARATVKSEKQPERVAVIATPRRNHGFLPSPRKGQRAPLLDPELWEERVSMQYLRYVRPVVLQLDAVTDHLSSIESINYLTSCYMIFCLTS